MSKRPVNHPGAFTTGLKKRHFTGRSAKGRKLAAKAEIARQRRVHWLKREHAHNAAAIALAAKLESCRPKHRCLSGACPVCAQAAQELFVQIVSAFSKEQTR
jgi:hypothetical protein